MNSKAKCILERNVTGNPEIDHKRYRRVEAAPSSAQVILARCWSPKPSKSRVLKAQCLECVGFDRGAISKCTAYACPLWKARPYQRRDGHRTHAMAVQSDSKSKTGPRQRMEPIAA